MTQVKIRGFRIELGEVESALARIRRLRRRWWWCGRIGRGQAAGRLCGSGGLERLLVQWTWRCCGPCRPSVLPDYMVPAVVVVLDALPLTVNGKLDRAALPEPEYAVGSGGGRSPASARRRSCAGCSLRCWVCRRSGVDDGFFDLGGHSLLATRLVSRVRAVLGVEVGDAGVVRGADGGGLGAAAGRGRRSVASGAGGAVARPERAAVVLRAAAAVVPGPVGGAECRPTTCRWRCGCPVRWTWRRWPPRCATWSGGTRCCARSSRVADGQPCQRMLDADEISRTGRWPMAAVARGRSCAWPWLQAAAVSVRPGRRGSAAGHGCSRLADRMSTCWCWWCTTSPATAGRWRRWRGTCRRRTRRARPAGPEWQPLPVQYADYALWQRELLGAEDDPDSRAVPPGRRTGAPRWPGCRRSWSCRSTGRARRWPRHRGGRRRVRGAGRGARAAARGWRGPQGVTLFMVLQAALAVLLSRLGPARHPDRVAGGRSYRRGAGRSGRVLRQHAGAAHRPVRRPDLHRAAGPGAGDGPGGLRPQDVPFERLVEELTPARSAGAASLFQVMLTVQNNAEAVLELPGLGATRGFALVRPRRSSTCPSTMHDAGWRRRA